MRTLLETLPSDPMLLQRPVRDMAAAVETRETEIGRFQEIIRKRLAPAVRPPLGTHGRGHGRRSAGPCTGGSGRRCGGPSRGRSGGRCPAARARPASQGAARPCARARRSSSPRTVRLVPAAARHCSRPGRAASHCPPLVRGQWRARCWTGFRHPSGCSARAARNSPAGAAERSSSTPPPSGWSPAGWQRRRCSRRC